MYYDHLQKSPHIQILMAAYNGALYIKEQIDSIIKQSYTDWELIISDDGSTDETKSIVYDYVNKFPDKIKIHNNEKNNLGACGNFFDLLKHSDAKYIMFCDQDDVWSGDKIEISVKEILKIESTLKDKKPVMVFTDLEVVDQELNLKSRSYYKYTKLNPQKTNMNRLIIQNVVMGCTIIMNGELRDLALQYKDPSQIIMHDWWTALVASAFGVCSYLDHVSIKHRQHNKNKIGARKIGIKLLYNKLIVNKNIKEQLKKIVVQAKIFLESYDAILPEAYKEMLEEYSKIYDYKKFKRIYIFFKYNIFKIHFVRIIGQLIYG